MNRFTISVLKTVRNLFRNSTTLSIILIGPLTLLAVLFFAYSSTEMHDLKIGYVDTPSRLLEQNRDILPESDVTLVPFDYIEDCRNSVNRQETHICLEYNAKNILVYYDPSRETVGLSIIAEIRENIARKEQARIQNEAGEIIDDVRQANTFFDEGQRFTNTLDHDLKTSQTSLENIQQQISIARSDIQTQITQLQSTKIKLQGYQTQLNDSRLNELGTLRNKLSAINYKLGLLETNQAVQQDQYTLSTIKQTRQEITSANNAILDAQTTIAQVRVDISQALYQVDQAILSLQRADTQLVNANAQIVTAKTTISQRQTQLSQIQQDLEQNKQSLSQIGSTNVGELTKVEEVGIYSSHTLRTNPPIGSVKYLAPKILLLLSMFIAVILSNIILLEEIHSHAYLRNLLTPNSGFIYLSSILTTTVLITLFESLLFLSVASSLFGFSAQLFSYFVPVVICLLLMIISYSCVGLICGFLIKDKSTSLLACIFFILITILLGGMFLPLERLSSSFNNIALAIPLTVSVSAIDQILFAGLTPLLWVYLKLAIITLGSIICLVIAAKIWKKKE